MPQQPSWFCEPTRRKCRSPLASQLIRPDSYRQLSARYLRDAGTR